MYSQNAEEQHIVQAFSGKIGRFLDIGAYDGKTFSNTLKLVELGWPGVCIEPDASSFVGLRSVHREHPDIQLVNAAFATSTGLVKFYSSGGDAVSTTDLRHKTLWEHQGHVKYQAYYAPTVTFSTIAEKFGGLFDFVNLDVEGTNWPLLQALPLGDMNVSVLCVEYEDKCEAMLDYCRPFGLSTLLYKSSENIVLGRPA